MVEDLDDDRRPKSLVGAAAATFATNGATVAFSLLNVLILARSLGPTGRGEIAFVIAVWVLTAGLATLGFEEANANFGGRHPERRAALAGNSVVAALVLGGLGAGLVGLLMTLVPGARGEVHLGLLLFALATLPSGLLGQSLKFLLQSDYRFGVTNLAWFASPALTALCNGVLALTGTLTVELVIVVFVVTNVCATVILVLSVARQFGFGSPDAGLARECFSFGIRSHMLRLLELGTYRGDQWLLGILAGPYEVGLYSIAVSLAEALFYVSGIIALVQRPHLVRALPAEAAEFGVRIFRRAVMLSAAVGAALFIAAPTLCVALFGESFHESGDDLRILSLAAVGVLAVDLFSCLVIAQRRPLMASVGGAATLLAMVVLNVILVPELGGDGAAIAKSIAYTAGGAVMVVIFVRMFAADPRGLIPGLEDIRWYGRKVREARVAMPGWRAVPDRVPGAMGTATTALQRVGLYGTAKALKHGLRRASGDAARQRAKMRKLYGIFVGEGDLCVDVGAHRGDRTAIFRDLGATVVAVEPDPRTVVALRRRFAGDTGVHLVAAGLSAKSGSMELRVSSTATTVSSMSERFVERLEASGRLGTHHWDGVEVVPVTTLDDVISEHGVPAFCKIDVEGYELEVLAGLSQPVAALSFEFSEEMLDVAGACIRRLTELGDYRYNYSADESLVMALDMWVTAAEMLGRLDALDAPYGDVYARISAVDNDSR